MRLPIAAVLFVLLVIASSAIALVAFASEITWSLFPQITLFILLIIVASYLIVRDPTGGVVSSAGTLFYVAIYVFNPLTVLFVVALGYAIGNTLPRGWVTWRACFNGAQMGLSALLGGIVFRVLGGNVASPEWAAQVLPILVGPLVYHVANNLFVAILIGQVRGVPLFRTWVSFVREFIWINLLGVPTAVLIAVLYTRVHHAFILLFLVSLPFQRWAMRLYLEERGTYAKIIEGLVRATELSLPGTKGHARRVADLSLALARELGLADRDSDLIEYAALLHDVGMVGLDDLLASGDAYTQVEELILSHARVGAQIVSEIPRPEIAEMVLRHHNHLRVTAELLRVRSIVLTGARVIALAEEVDSRLYGLFPFKESESLESVLEAIRSFVGTKFDRNLVDALLSILEKGEALSSIAPRGEGLRKHETGNIAPHEA